MSSDELTDHLVATWPDEVTTEQALAAADDFLAGLLDHTGISGYIDPDAGEVSTRFVLMLVRKARSILSDRAATHVGEPHREVAR